MKKISRYLAISLLTLFTACATTPPSAEPPVSRPAEVLGREPLAAVDYQRLQRALGLERAAEKLGYAEKSFDTCQVGYGYSVTQECHQENFVVIHIQLLCRQSEGTISTVLTRADMYPLKGRTVRWSLPKGQGILKLDSEGFGQIITVLPQSPKNDRLKIAVDNEFLYMRAGEIDRVVTPKDWCN